MIFYWLRGWDALGDASLGVAASLEENSLRLLSSRFVATRTHSGFSSNIKENKERPEMGHSLLAPRVGFEPTTNWLTANCSATELPRIIQNCANKITRSKKMIKVL